MSNQKLKKQIIEWLTPKPYWLQYLGNHILEGEPITDELIDSAYAFYREDEGLAPVELERPEIQFSEVVLQEEQGEEPLFLEAIKNINFVNALVGGQTIKIGRHMTVIYGGNGAGKSGYIRLLNNAFDSRGDKEILPNVFGEDADNDPECEFTFQRSEESYDLSFPADQDHSEFGHFCVFDSRCVKAILDEENRLAFTPSGFDFFDTLIVAHDGIKRRLADEIDARSQPHEFSEMFVNDNDVQTLILELGPATELAQLEQLATFGEAEQSQKAQAIQRLAELRALDKTKAIAELDTTRDQLARFCSTVDLSSPLVSKEKIGKYRDAIVEVNRFDALAKTEGIESLKKYDNGWLL